MTRDRWTFILVLLNAFITNSQENEINPDIEGYDLENLQNNGPPEMMILPQDCFEVCNDYECLYLCPQPIRGVKRCITPLKSNKKTCCQNGQKDFSSGTDNLKGAGKHIWQARDQLLGLKKEIENDLANRRYSLLKGLQPLASRQHNRESLLKLGTKTSKPKSSSVKLVCTVNDKKTNSPNNFVNSDKDNNNDAALGDSADGNNENNSPQALPLYNEKELSRENENGRTSDCNNEELLTTIAPILRNKNIEDTREQVSSPNLNSVYEGREEMQRIFTDVSEDTEIESQRAPYHPDIPKTSDFNGYNTPNVEESNRNDFLNQASPFANSEIERPSNYNYETSIPINGKIETMGQNIFQSNPVIFYTDTYRGKPMEIENNVLSETNNDDFVNTTPYARGEADIKKPIANTAENIEVVNFNSGEMTDNPVTIFQDPFLTTSGTIGDKQSKINENILVESKSEFITNGSKNYTYTEDKEIFTTPTTKGSSVHKIQNIEESAPLLYDEVDEKVPSDKLERVLTDSYLRSEENEEQLLMPSITSKSDVKILSSDETGVRNESKQLNKSENDFIIHSGEIRGSSNELNDTEHIDDDPSPDDYEKSEMDRPISETNFSSGRDGFQADNKKSLLEILKLSDQKQNYTYRMLQELISRYNLTSDLKVGGTKAPECQPLRSSLDHETTKHYLAQGKPLLENKTNKNEYHFTMESTTHSQYSSMSIISPTNIEKTNLDVENETKEESTYMPSATEINYQQYLSETNNNSTRNFDISQNIVVESPLNILNSFKSDGSGTSNGITFHFENTTHGPPETIISISKDNIRDTVIDGNVKGISLDNGTASGNRKLIKPSHSLVSRAEQVTTTASVSLIQNGSLENYSDTDDSQLGSPLNQLKKKPFHIITNVTEKEMGNKNENITEKQFNVESNIEEPIFEIDSVNNNQYENETKNSKTVDQELLYDVENSESSNIDSSIDDQLAKISVGESIDETLYNETESNNLYDQKVLQLIPNVSETPLPTTFDDKIVETKNHSIEEIYLKLDESNGNSSTSIENENNYSELNRSKNNGDISTELNDSELYTLEDKRDGSIMNKKKLSDIINTELNSLKQDNVILKKREEGDEISYADDQQCDCDYPTSRDDELDTNPNSGQYIDRANTHLHPVYPMFILIPVPYPVCDCENKKSHNSLNNNYINVHEPYVSREHSEPSQDYSFNSVYNDMQHKREGKAALHPPHMPDFLFPFVPWGGMYPIFPQVMDQQYENNLQARDAANENFEKLGITTDDNPSGDELKNSNPGDIAEFQQESLSASETARFSRNEPKETVDYEYIFVDGQYVKVLKNENNKRNEDLDGTEETPTTITTPSLVTDTSTAALYVPTTQQPIPVKKFVTSVVATDANENGHRPVNYFYPSDFGTAQNRFYGYFPGYFFTHQQL